MKTRTHHAETITAADIAALADACRARALAAREAVTELTPEQTSAVGGGIAGMGISLDRPFPNGVLPYFRVADFLTTPSDRMNIPTEIGSAKGF